MATSEVPPALALTPEGGASAVTPPRPVGHHDGVLMRSTLRIGKRPPGERTSPLGCGRVGALRREARRRLEAQDLGSAADDAALIVSELVTNAIVHSGAEEVTVTLSVRGDILRVSVRDGVPSHHTLLGATPGAADEHGRGLILVRSITEERRGSCGVEDGGTTTWCAWSVTAC